jgi:putative transposase
MPRYIRAHIPGGTLFFTVALLERRRRLLTEHVDVLRAAFASVRAQSPFTIDATVILPDHLHCIWTLPEDDADFSGRWHAIKSKFSRSLPKQEQLSARRVVKGERGIGQRRF